MPKKKIIVLILSLVGTFSAAIMVSGIKLLSLDLNPFIIAFYRCLFGVIVILPFMIFTKYGSWKTNNLKLQWWYQIHTSILKYGLILVGILDNQDYLLDHHSDPITLTKGFQVLLNTLMNYKIHNSKDY